MSNISAFSRFSSDLQSFASSNHIVSQPQGNWFQSSVSQLNKLVRFHQGWDGYNAQPVSFENAHFAMGVLQSICRDDTPAPAIIPGVSGDLQIEWHTLLGDLELHIKAPNDVHAWYSTVDDAEDELSLAFDFTKVVNWLIAVTEAPIVTVAAAA